MSIKEEGKQRGSFL